MLGTQYTYGSGTMVSMVALTSRSANSLSRWPSHRAPRSLRSLRSMAAIGVSLFVESWIFTRVCSFSSCSFRIALDWMEDNRMRLMHNSHDVHAFRETAPDR